MADERCPLCGKSGRMHKAKLLYNHAVCRRCHYIFAFRRQYAYALDAMLWRLLWIPVLLFAAYKMLFAGFSRISIIGTVGLSGLVLLGVFCCKDCFAGQSLGKAIMGVRVIDRTTGKPIGAKTSFKRNLPLLIPFMPLVVCFLLYKGYRKGDAWANSKVIWKKYASHLIFLPESSIAQTHQNS
jgi:uncharacterized RDD family membrane protein YckC